MPPDLCIFFLFPLRSVPSTVVYLTLTVTYIQCHFLGNSSHHSSVGIGKGSLSGGNPRTSGTSRILGWNNCISVTNRCKPPRRPGRRNKRLSIVQYKERAKVNMYFETKCHPPQCLCRTGVPRPKLNSSRSLCFRTFLFPFQIPSSCFYPQATCVLVLLLPGSFRGGWASPQHCCFGKTLGLPSINQVYLAFRLALKDKLKKFVCVFPGQITHALIKRNKSIA